MSMLPGSRPCPLPHVEAAAKLADDSRFQPGTELDVFSVVSRHGSWWGFERQRLVGLPFGRYEIRVKPSDQEPSGGLSQGPVPRFEGVRRQVTLPEAGPLVMDLGVLKPTPIDHPTEPRDW